MTKFLTGSILLILALALSTVSGAFSVVGMMLLFSSRPISIAILTGLVEASKGVVACWLKFYWKPSVSWWVRTYLAISVAVAMVISALGSYGFLSAAHLEQVAEGAPTGLQVDQLERQVEQEKGKIARLTTRQGQIDKSVDLLLSSSKAKAGLRAGAQQKAERASIQTEIDASYKTIDGLEAKLLPLKVKNGAVEAKLGPVKYVAALFGMQDPEVAVRMIIVLLMVVFDPMALAMMIAALITLKEWREDQKEKSAPDNISLPPLAIIDTYHKTVVDPEEAVDEIEGVAPETEGIFDEPVNVEPVTVENVTTEPTLERVSDLTWKRDLPPLPGLPWSMSKPTIVKDTPEDPPEASTLPQEPSAPEQAAMMTDEERLALVAELRALIDDLEATPVVPVDINDGAPHGEGDIEPDPTIDDRIPRPTFRGGWLNRK